MWYVDYYLHGKRIRKPISTGRREAKLYLNEVESKILRGEYEVLKPEKNLIDYINERKEYFIKTRKPDYAKRCSYIFDHFKKYILNENIKYVSYFTKEHAEKYVQERLNHIKPKTANDELYIIRWIFESAQEHNYILKNPIKKFKKLKFNPKPHRYFTDEELDAIYGNSPKEHGNVYKFLTNTGLRLSELSHLEWSDINLEDKVLSVSFKEDWIPKNSQERHIPINDSLYDLITEMNADNSKEGYVFDIQGRQSKEHLLKNLQDILEEHNFEKGRLHTFRHTFATKLAHVGVGIYEIQQLLGHSDIRMTQRYAKLSIKNLESAVKKLDNKK